VRVGNFDRRELRNSSGVTGAAPIFNSVMLAAMKRARGAIPIGDDDPIVAPSGDVELVAICAVSGSRPSMYCPATQKEWLSKSAPAQFCSWHHDGYTDWPAEYREWAKVKEPRKRETALRVTYPPHGATYLIDPTLRSSSQMLKLRATSSVTWRVDGKRVGSKWPLIPGQHTIAAVDRRGRRDEVTIYVK
jgi:membrane carboxypeptidase/penicillin-binding protein PbpC